MNQWELKYYGMAAFCAVVLLALVIVLVATGYNTVADASGYSDCVTITH